MSLRLFYRKSNKKSSNGYEKNGNVYIRKAVSLIMCCLWLPCLHVEFLFLQKLSSMSASTLYLCHHLLLCVRVCSCGQVRSMSLRLPPC